MRRVELMALGFSEAIAEAMVGDSQVETYDSTSGQTEFNQKGIVFINPVTQALVINVRKARNIGDRRFFATRNGTMTLSLPAGNDWLQAQGSGRNLRFGNNASTRNSVVELIYHGSNRWSASHGAYV